MNYEETLEYINSVNWKGSVLGLERIRELMNRLGNPQKDLKFIHIAGTNGKGSTAAFLSSILVQAGYTTGLFTSPFIEVYNERMQVNNQNISNTELSEIVDYIKPFVDEMKDKPTEFELNTAISLVYFKKHNCDIVVFEVGMGGALDSTNIIDSPEVAVIVAIGLDHTVELGDTIEKIAATKAGIIKDDCSVVLYKQGDSVTEVIRNRCMEVHADLYITEPENVFPGLIEIGAQHFTYPGYGELSMPLIGTYQLDNVATALKTVEVLNNKGYSISKENVRDGLAETKWPGRFEVISKNPLFIVDGAHNPHGIRATSESIKKVFENELIEGKKFNFIFGVMADKDYLDMLNRIIPFAKNVFCVTPDNPRALQANELAEIIRNMNVDARSFDTIKEAIDYAFAQNDTIIALGSLYMIGDIKRYVRTRK